MEPLQQRVETLEDLEIDLLLEGLFRHYGYDFRQYARSSLRRRLWRRVYAEGVQIYRWNGSGWAFVAPEAVLSSDAGGNSTVGTHYAGPTWESNSGSKVIATRQAGCTPDLSAIPWLLLKTVSTTGPGIFSPVTFIQRVNTTGGLAPTAPGTMVNEVVEIPYTTEYYFYRAED